MYALRTLAALARFGGPSFARALATTALSASLSTATKQLIKAGSVDASASYLDAILDQCSFWIGAYPSQQLKASFDSALTALRAAAVDVVHCFVQRSHTAPKRMDQLESLFIEALLVAIHQGCTSVQNKMLHTLHTILTAKTSLSHRPDLTQRRLSSTSHSTGMHQRTDSLGKSDVDAGHASPTLTQKPNSPASSAQQRHPHRLLLALLQRGLAAPSNRLILQHWSDFILMTAPLYRSSVHHLLLPLNQTICDLISKAMVEVGASYAAGASRPTFGAELVVQSHDTQCSFLESDLLLLINLAERTLMLATGSHGEPAITHTGRGGSADNSIISPSSAVLNEKTSQDNGAPSLLGYVSNVFSSETTGDEKSESNTEGRNRNLLLTVRTLHRVWTLCGMELSATDAKSLSLDAMRSKVKLRSRRAFERIYRAHPAETVEALLHCWQSSVRPGRARNDNATNAVIEILDIVTPSAQILVTFLCDVLGARIARSDSDRARKTAAATFTATSVSDATLFRFFDAVLSRMEPAEATQVWPVVIVFVKDFVAHGMARKMHVYPMLRIFTALAEKICLTAAMEDKRTRRDLQDNFAKLVDSCILISGRSFDQSTWIRRSGRDNVEDLDKEAADFASELLSLDDDSSHTNSNSAEA